MNYYAVVDTILNRGAKVNIQNQYQDTPLHEAARMCLSAPLVTGRKQIVILLLQRGSYSYLHRQSDQIVYKITNQSRHGCLY